TRSLHIGSSAVMLQCNSVRQASASASIDPAALAARPCFLCADHLPKSQCAIVYRKDWLILCNPAPIFEPHFTISSMSHQPQSIEQAASAMLDLACDLSGNFTLFYNGPACGASAPDHLHLQAAPVATLPHEKELMRQLCSSRASDKSGWIEWVRREPVRIGISKADHRPAIFLLGRSRLEMLDAFHRVLEALLEVQPSSGGGAVVNSGGAAASSGEAKVNSADAVVNSAEAKGNSAEVIVSAGEARANPGGAEVNSVEPMVNVFATYADACWTVWIYPRRAHRPSCYGQSIDDFLISPGAVDMAGLLIVPRESDFDRLNEELVAQIFNEVLLTPADLARVGDRLASRE
ncbi:MAG: DUF4922 domain-containing protein, partial [Phycisphaerae bacterium]|nr:DUF4922 domain-containing protein [Phycisphaerae bacterium]